MKAQVKASAICFMTLAVLSGMTGAYAKKIELTVWDWHKPRIDVLKPKIVEYMKLNPDISIKQVTVPFGGGFSDKLLTSVIAGTPPDIIQFHNSWTGLLANMLAPYPSDLFPISRMSNEYYEFDKACKMKDGRFYFYPDGIMAPLIFYNTSLWAKAGLAAVPKTWDQMRVAAKKLNQIGPDGKIDVGGFFFSLAGLFDDINYQAGGGMYNKNHTGVAYDTDAGRKSMNLVSSMALSDGVRPTGDLFFKGKSGMVYAWTYYEGDMRTARITPEKLQWSVFTLPTLDGAEDAVTSRNNYECGYGVVKNAAPAKRNESFKFLKWLYSDDTWYLALNRSVGRLPGKRSMWNRKELLSDPVLSALIKQVPNTVFPGERPSWIDTALGTMENSILMKKYSPADALRRAQEECNRQWRIQPPVWMVDKRLGN